MELYRGDQIHAARSEAEGHGALTVVAFRGDSVQVYDPVGVVFDVPVSGVTTVNGNRVSDGPGDGRLRRRRRAL